MSKFDRISCHHFIEREGRIYFSNWFYNGLFQVEPETGKTTFLGSFEKETKSEYNLHWELFQWKGMIYFFPRRGRHIHVYSPTNHSMSTIEVRTLSDNFFRIDEVLVDGENAIFLPMEKNAPIKKLDLNTRILTDIKKIPEASKVIHLSQSWPSFPIPQLLERYQIEKADKFSWKQMPDGRWCAFLPMGRHLLWHTPGTPTIKSIPLTVVNEAELDAYLQPLRQAYLCQGALTENRLLTFHEYLKTIVYYNDNLITTNHEERDNGQSIWHRIKV